MPVGNSPYMTNFMDGKVDHELDPSTQMKQFKAEERATHKAPNILPYELKELPANFGAMVENGMQAAKTLETFLKTADVKNKKELLQLKKNTEKMVIYLMQTVDYVLEKQTIGASHAANDIEDEKIENEVY